LVCSKKSKGGAIKHQAAAKIIIEQRGWVFLRRVYIPVKHINTGHFANARGVRLFVSNEVVMVFIATNSAREPLLARSYSLSLEAAQAFFVRNYPQLQTFAKKVNKRASLTNFVAHYRRR